MKPLALHLEAAGISVEKLVAATGIELRLVRSIAAGNYIPSPTQRAKIAEALGVAVDDVSWDHAVPVQHLRGNGPQSGRPT
jgi:transcriptional regulator with XRE-family HTH domain